VVTEISQAMRRSKPLKLIASSRPERAPPDDEAFTLTEMAATDAGRRRRAPSSRAAAAMTTDGLRANDGVKPAVHQRTAAATGSSRSWVLGSSSVNARQEMSQSRSSKIDPPARKAGQFQMIVATASPDDQAAVICA
jgi:hypothetical protein